LIGTGAGARLIFSRVFLTFRCIFAVYIFIVYINCIFTVYINCYTRVKQEQESINFSRSEVTFEAGVNF